MQNRVHLITLGVKDMAVSRAYYEAMGWVTSPISMDEVTFFQAGDQVLGLYLQEALDHDTGLNGAKPGGVTLAVNVQSRDEVDAMYAKALEAGATVLTRPREMPWGGYTGYVADPDGHPWEFSHVAQLVPDENGALILPDSL
ncbi:VOC family protein [Magnetovibrio sp.]|uniref:VOC family protein n=1 Tax=Magnetovibrio sp. TaxID=2024836 RepID=UPI002F957368